MSEGYAVRTQNDGSRTFRVVVTSDGTDYGPFDIDAENDDDAKAIAIAVFQQSRGYVRPIEQIGFV